MRWLDDPVDETDQVLRAGLDQARSRSGNEIARRRVWSHISQPELFAAPPRRIRPVVMFSALGLSVLSAAIFLMRPDRSDSRGPVVAIEGLAPAPSGAALPPVADAVLLAPAQVRTLTGESRVFRLRGGARVVIAAESILNVDAGDRPVVEKGRVTLEVPHQPPGRQFSVGAGPYVIVVVGTRFQVRVDPSQVAVDVDEGVVEVWKGKERQVLRAGDSWRGVMDVSVPGGTARVKQPVARPSSARRIQKATRSPRRLAFEPSIANSIAKDSAPAVGAPLASPAPSPVVALAPLPLPPVVLPAVSPPRVPTAAERFREAKLAVVAGDPDKAEALLRSLAEGRDATAENAAYELGRLQRETLMRPREAVKVWNRYRMRFPRGLLRAEADLSIVETLVALDDDDAALAEAEAFLSRFPDSERRPEVMRVVTRLRRSAADVGAAGPGR